MHPAPAGAEIHYTYQITMYGAMLVKGIDVMVRDWLAAGDDLRGGEAETVGTGIPQLHGEAVRADALVAGRGLPSPVVGRQRPVGTHTPHTAHRTPHTAHRTTSCYVCMAEPRAVEEATP